jgi:hypothetical protein
MKFLGKGDRTQGYKLKKGAPGVNEVGSFAVYNA